MRYLYFLTVYNQWFKNLQGIKEFAEQVMGWLLRNTLALANKLKKRNTQLSEKIKENRAVLNKLYQHPVIDANEFYNIRAMIRKYNFIIIICILGELFFNYFATKSILNFKGAFAVIGQVMLAFLITWGSIALFEKLFHYLLYEKPYKGEYQEKRNWFKLAILVILAFGYEYLIYYICLVRGIEIEGGSGDGLISTAMMILGLLIPVIAGYYSYERSRYIDPYKNTLTIAKLEKDIAKMIREINTNKQKMVSNFKQNCQRKWAILQEFKTYKENYNIRKNIPEENLNGHFSENEAGFNKEAVERYEKETIDGEKVNLPFTTIEKRNNGKPVLIEDVKIESSTGD